MLCSRTEKAAPGLLQTLATHGWGRRGAHTIGEELGRRKPARVRTPPLREGPSSAGIPVSPEVTATPAAGSPHLPDLDPSPCRGDRIESLRLSGRRILFFFERGWPPYPGDGTL
jgi:hypothetical protein